MRTIARKEWGARYGFGTATAGLLELVMIHHTAGPDLPTDADLAREKLAVAGIETQHVRDNGWNGIAYNWLIFPSGRVYEGRGWRQQGAHCKGQNHRSVGIAFVMNSEAKEPTAEAMEACRQLLAMGVLGNHLAPEFAIKGHRDFDATKCPGAKLYARLSELGNA